MRRGGGRLSLFLIEIIVVVLVFALSSAICLNIFSAARQKSAASESLNRAVTAAQSAAETLKACGFDAGAAASALSGVCSGDTVIVTYNDDFSVCSGDAAYIMTITIASGSPARAHIDISGDSEIFSLNVAGRKGGGT